MNKMNISLEQAAAFIYTVDELSFKEAAKALNKHPSTVADLVKNLEIELGFELFTRKVRKLTLTPQGEALYDYAAALLYDKQRLESKVESINNKKPTTLVIASDNALKSLPFSTIIKPLIQTQKIMDFSILLGEPKEVVEWVKNGRADVGFSVEAHDPSRQCIFENVKQFEIVNIASIERTSITRDISRRELNRIPQISYEFLRKSKGETWHNLSRNVYRTNDIEVLTNMVALDIGWARVPDFVAQSLIEEGSIRTFSIEGNASEPWGYDSILLPSSLDHPLVKHLLTTLKSS